MSEVREGGEWGLLGRAAAGERGREHEGRGAKRREGEKRSRASRGGGGEGGGGWRLKSTHPWTP
eukprot:659762-Hanusia_phi.AAC.1